MSTYKQLRMQLGNPLATIPIFNPEIYPEIVLPEGNAIPLEVFEDCFFKIATVEQLERYERVLERYRRKYKTNPTSVSRKPLCFE